MNRLEVYTVMVKVQEACLWLVPTQDSFFVDFSAETLA